MKTFSTVRLVAFSITFDPDATVRSVIDSTPGTVYCRRPGDSHAVESASDGVRDLTGYAPEELAGDDRGWLDIVHEDDCTALIEAVEAGSTAPATEHTYRIRTAGGRERWVRDRFHSTSDGRCVEGFVVDVTERMTDRQELQAEAKLLDAVFESIPVHTYVKDREGRHQRVSDHLGIADELLGNTDSDLEIVSEQHASQAHEADMRVIEEGESIIDTEEYLPGIDQWNLTSKVPLYVDGEIAGLIGVSRRITERKRTERELQLKTERLEEFVDTVTHDIKNPLSVARGYVDLALEAEADEQHLQEVAQSLDRVDEIIDDVLTLSRTGYVDLDTGTVSLAEVCRTAWQNVVSSSASLSIREEDAEFVADRSQLLRIFENLFRNAVDHCGDEVSITVEALYDPAGRTIGFAIEYDGPGIPSDDRDCVFETNYTIEEGGSGFGLSIVDDIVDAHGWSIGITESETGGARFEITGVQPSVEL